LIAPSQKPSLRKVDEKSSPRKPRPLPERAALMLGRLRDLPGMDDGEKSLHALGLAASPDERWALWARQMRSNGYWKPSKPTASGAS
jgi:hypothetical protein